MNNKKELDKIESLEKELKESRESVWDQPYKCLECGDRVNYTFIMPMIKSSGLCPNCFSKDEE